MPTLEKLTVPPSTAGPQRTVEAARQRPGDGGRLVGRLGRVSGLAGVTSCAGEKRASGLVHMGPVGRAADTLKDHVEGLEVTHAGSIATRHVCQFNPWSAGCCRHSEEDPQGHKSVKESQPPVLRGPHRWKEVGPEPAEHVAKEEGGEHVPAS